MLLKTGVNQTHCFQAYYIFQEPDDVVRTDIPFPMEITLASCGEYAWSVGLLLVFHQKPSNLAVTMGKSF